jgi:16S rRNA (uracil1498-N3)-methyltransferase
MPLAADGAPSVVRIASLAATGGEIVIAGDEAHYLARVVRVRAGERVTATDGRGATATLEVIETGVSIRARVLDYARQERRATLELWCGAPEGDRADWLIEKLGELGVATFVPVDFKRVRWERAEARRERWERLATAALRQSRSAWQLEVRPPVTLADALRGIGTTGARWICLPEGTPWVAPRRDEQPVHSVAAVGPSSGFGDEELKSLSEAGFAPVSLARSRLRTETAAITMAALWAAADNG